MNLITVTIITTDTKQKLFLPLNVYLILQFLLILTFILKIKVISIILLI